MKTSAAGFILAILMALPAQAAHGGAPVITFGATTVQVSGVTPGGTVVIYGVTFGRRDFTNGLNRVQAALTDDSHKGVVTYDLKDPIPPLGVWVAVDATNGQFAVAAPERNPLPVARALPQPFRKNGAGLVDTFSHGYFSLEMLYIHPGGGVWVAHAVDGSRADRDARPGVTGVSLGDAVSLMPQGGTKPEAFAPGGVLIAFDMTRFEVLTVRITGADLGGAQ
jgi:hypothetical protein